MNVIESLKWRAAIKKFDGSKKVSNEDLELLIESANLAPTSGGLQPFKLVVVQNEELQAKLTPFSYNQKQVEDASHILVFAIEAEITPKIVDDYISLAAEVRGQGKEDLVNYTDSLKMFISSMDDTTKRAWARNQAYISLGTVLSAAAALKIDSCPMEGFDAIQYQEILGLKEQNLIPVVILPIGYRSDEDVHSKAPKVRKKREKFVLEIK